MQRSNRFRSGHFGRFGHHGHAEALTRHRHEVRTSIYLPVILTGIMLVLVVVGMIVVLTAGQFKTAANFMSLLLLVPAALLCLVPYVVIVALLALLTKFNTWLPGQFEPVRVIISQTNDVALQMARIVTRPLIWIGQRAAWLEKFIAGSSGDSGERKATAEMPKALPSGLKEQDNA